jgi:DNA-binding MarR family transcriptional regulator
LNERHLVVLQSVASQDSVTDDELAALSELAPEVLDKVLDQLQARGLIVREDNSSTLTDLGRDALARLNPLLRRVGLGDIDVGEGLGRFTDDARRVIAYAREQLGPEDGRHIEPEQLLLGVLRAEGTLAHDVLAVCGVTLAGARREVASLLVTVANGGDRIGMFGARAVTCLKRAMHQALSDAVKQITPEHILLAILGGPDGVWPQLVYDLEIDPQAVYGMITAAISDPESWPDIRQRMIRRRLEQLDALLLANEAREDVVRAIADARTDERASAAVSELLGIDRHTAAYVVRQPLSRFTALRIEETQLARRALSDRVGG